MRQLDQISNLMIVTPAPLIGPDERPELPTYSVGMIRRVASVTEVTATAATGADVRRTDLIPSGQGLGISVVAVQTNLLSTLGGSMGEGVFLNVATEHYPAVVLGATAAERLGISRVGVRVWLGGHWFTVVGIMGPVAAASDLDASVLIGFPIADSWFALDGSPTNIYLRSDPSQVGMLATALPYIANPAHPEDVTVSRPSDALAARAAARTALNTLLLTLGVVALLVGGLGIANIMVISVVERRSEIGLRRALGATRLHVGLQFLAEAVALSSLSTLCGLLLGALVTAVDADLHAWPVILPPAVLAGAIGMGVGLGILAGIYPAARAARLAPNEALRVS
jgi:putative ABC transport system permease protein